MPEGDAVADLTLCPNLFEPHLVLDLNGNPIPNAKGGQVLDPATGVPIAVYDQAGNLLQSLTSNGVSLCQGFRTGADGNGSPYSHVGVQFGSGPVISVISTAGQDSTQAMTAAQAAQASVALLTASMADVHTDVQGQLAAMQAQVNAIPISGSGAVVTTNGQLAVAPVIDLSARLAAIAPKTTGA